MLALASSNIMGLRTHEHIDLFLGTSVLGTLLVRAASLHAARSKNRSLRKTSCSGLRCSQTLQRKGRRNAN
jgi:hypothetical protein